MLKQVNQIENRVVAMIKRNWHYSIAFALPWVVALVHGVIFSTWPIGDDTIITGDLKAQYVQLYYELWNKVHDGDSIYYSWNAVGGYDFYSNLTYYLMSPFTLIVLFFPKNLIMNVLQLIIVLKWSFVSCFMVYYFYNTHFNKIAENKKMVSLYLGLVCSFASSMVFFLKYPNWLDPMILFPVLLLALEQLVGSGSWKKYCLLLACVIICNYYIAYQICIFLVFWFLILVSEQREGRIKKFVLFAKTSILSVVMASVSLVPSVFISLGRSSGNEEKVLLSFLQREHNTLASYAKSMMSLTDLVSVFDTTPNLFFSILGVMLTFLYIFNKSASKIKRILLLVWLFLLMSFFVGGLNLFWHAFHVPHGAYNRFSNLYVFLMAFIALQMLNQLNDINLHSLMLFVIVSVIAIAIVFVDYREQLGLYVYLITSVFVFVYVLLFLEKKRNEISYKKFVHIIAIFGILEMVINGLNAFDDLSGTDLFSDREVVSVLNLNNQIELEEGERISCVLGQDNIGLLINKPVGCGFLSCVNGELVELYKKIGFNYVDDAKVVNMGGSPLMNLMFNVRYGISGRMSSFSDAELVTSVDDVSLYRMQRLAGLGYMVDDDVLEWDVDTNVFSIQNDFAQKSAGQGSIFQNIEVNLQSEILVNEQKTNIINYEVRDNAYIVSYDYEKDSMNALQVDFEVEHDMDLYVFTRGRTINTIQAYVDGVSVVEDLNNKYQNFLHFGYVKKGQNIRIILNYPLHTELDQKFQYEFQFAEFYEGNYAKVYEKLCKSVYDIQEMNSNYVKGTINVNQPGIMMTSITADKGFDVYVDGTKTEYEEIGNALIGVPLEKGEHVVEFVYRTPYFLLGVVLSLVGVIIFTGCTVVQRYKNVG